MTSARVTGVAGFMGSTLTAELLRRGGAVVGVECFSHSSDPPVKHASVAVPRGDGRLSLWEIDRSSDAGRGARSDPDRAR